jgi:hypothetical protein
VLRPSHAAFYTETGLTALRDVLVSGGVFALWSDDPPDAEFSQALSAVFATARADVVTFPNPLTRGTSTNTVYVACRWAVRRQVRQLGDMGRPHRRYRPHSAPDQRRFLYFSCEIAMHHS